MDVEAEPRQAPNYTILNLNEVEPSTSAPPGLVARVAREQMRSRRLGVSHFHYEPGVRTPFGHSHEHQEEVYVVIAGSGRARVGTEIVELTSWDTLRVAPTTLRAFEGGPAGMDVIAIGSEPRPGEGGKVVEDFWNA